MSMGSFFLGVAVGFVGLVVLAVVLAKRTPKQTPSRLAARDAQRLEMALKALQAISTSGQDGPLVAIARRALDADTALRDPKI